jgi:hypothetical protein
MSFERTDATLARESPVGMRDGDALRLARCEVVIQRGLETFLEVAEALLEIRDGHLYRSSGWCRFDDYCRERWRMSASRARQLIGALASVTNVTLDGLPAPTSEGVARALAGLSPEEQVEVWREAVATAADGVPTAAHVEAVRLCLGQRRHGSRCPDPTVEYYTLDPIRAAVLDVLGEIDLDPAAEGRGNIPARRHYTAADDGLAKPWYGRVYLNHPFGLPPPHTDRAWVEKLVDCHRRGDVVEAIALVRVSPGSAWFEPLWNYPICWFRGRPEFGRPDGKTSGSTFDVALPYLGPDLGRFYRAFEPLGPIVARISEADACRSQRRAL